MTGKGSKFRRTGNVVQIKNLDIRTDQWSCVKPVSYELQKNSAVRVRIVHWVWKTYKFACRDTILPRHDGLDFVQLCVHMQNKAASRF